MQLSPSHVHISTAFPHISASPVQCAYFLQNFAHNSLGPVHILRDVLVCPGDEVCHVWRVSHSAELCALNTPQSGPLCAVSYQMHELCPTWSLLVPVLPSVFICVRLCPTLFVYVLLFSSVSYYVLLCLTVFFYLNLPAAYTVSSALCPR